MRPILVASLQSLFRWWWKRGIAIEPVPHIVVVKLFAPEHSRERLTHDQFSVVRHLSRRSRRVKIVRILDSRRENRLKAGAEITEWRRWIHRRRRSSISGLRRRCRRGIRAAFWIRRGGWILIRQPQLQRDAPARLENHRVQPGHLCSGLLRIHSGFVPVY